MRAGDRSGRARCCAIAALWRAGRARRSSCPVEPPCGRCDRRATGAARHRVHAERRDPRALRSTRRPTIDAFPGDTEQLGVEVHRQRRRGRSRPARPAPLDVRELCRGREIPIVMAPPDGFCPTASPARRAARRAGWSRAPATACSIVGGTDRSGTRAVDAPSTTIAATATFDAVSVPGAFDDPATASPGAVLDRAARRPRRDHRDRARRSLAYFDPATRAFSAPDAVRRARVSRGVRDRRRRAARHGRLRGRRQPAACSEPLRPRELRLPARQARRSAAARRRCRRRETRDRRHAVRPRRADRRRAPLRARAGSRRSGRGRSVRARRRRRPSRSPAWTRQTAALDGGALLSAFDDAGGSRSAAAAILAPSGRRATAIAPARRDAGRAARRARGRQRARARRSTRCARTSPTTNRGGRAAAAPPASLANAVAVRLAGRQRARARRGAHSALALPAVARRAAVGAGRSRAPDGSAAGRADRARSADADVRMDGHCARSPRRRRARARRRPAHGHRLGHRDREGA